MHLYQFYIYFELFATIYIAYIVTNKSYIQMIVDHIFELESEVDTIINNFVSQVNGLRRTLKTIAAVTDLSIFNQALVSASDRNLKVFEEKIANEIPALRNLIKSICQTIGFSYTAFYLFFYCVTLLLFCAIMKSNEFFYLREIEVNYWNVIGNFNILTFIFLMAVWLYDGSTKLTVPSKWKSVNFIKQYWNRLQIVKPIVKVIKLTLRLQRGFKVTIGFAFLALIASFAVEVIPIKNYIRPELNHTLIITLSISIPCLNLFVYYLKAYLRAKNIRKFLKHFNPEIYDITGTSEYKQIQSCLDSHKIVQAELRLNDQTPNS